MSDDIGNAFQRAIVLHQQGQLAEAESLYRRVLAVAADHGAALGMLGLLEAERGNHPEAIELLNRTIAVNPSDANFFVSRGNSLLALGRLDDALADYQAALTLNPNFDEAWNNAGVVLQNQKRLEPALDAFERALALKPENINAAVNRGVVLHDLRRYREAVDSFDNALSFDENDSEAFYGRANALRCLGEHEDALFSYDRALELRPNFVEAHTNRGNALRDLKRPTEALAGYDRALAFRPDYSEALHHRGIVLREINRPQEAIAGFDRVLEMNPDSADAHWNRSLCHLLLGNFAAGWREYEWRWGMEQSRHSKRHFSQPLWLGDQSLIGKTILLHAEQGLGDTLQFCRFAKAVAAQGATVAMEVQPPLKALLTGLDGVSQLLAQGDPLPSFDYHCPLMSLPLALGTDLETIPCDIPYIKSDPKRVEEWKGKLASSAGPRIGVAWSGNDPGRSMPLAALAEALPDRIQYVSLQKEINPGDRAIFEQRGDIVHFGADFCDTAAIVEHMDLVVTVDTSLAHLAAAMGKKVWILLPFGGDWIWLMNRDDTPWYPTARLFRSPVVNDWSDVLRRLGDELRREFPAARS